MEECDPSWTGWRWISAFIGAGVLAWILGLLNILGDNSSLAYMNYGLPLTYMRLDLRGSSLTVFQTLADHMSFRQSWWQALIYDIAVVISFVLAFAFTVHQWSEKWTPHWHIAFDLTCLTIILPWTMSLPLSWTALGLVGLLAALVAFAYASWTITSRYIGHALAGLGPAASIVVLIVGGYSAAPHDPYRNSRPADLPLLLTAMESSNPSLRGLALWQIADLFEHGHGSLDPIIKALDDSDQNVRRRAKMRLSRFGPNAIAAVPRFIQLIDDKTFFFEAADALKSLGPTARDAVPVLEDRLKTANDAEKLAICEALWAIRKNATLVVPVLFELLPRTEKYQKLDVCRALWKSSQSAKTVVPAVIELLNDDFGPIRVDAANLLGQIGPAAKDAVPTLIEMVNYEPPPVQPRPQVAAVLNANGVPSPIPGEMPEAEFYPRIRDAAKRALERIDPGWARNRVDP